MTTDAKIIRELKRLANIDKAKVMAGFFKTGPGQYGAGDIFIGLTAPMIKEIARQHHDASLDDLNKLLTDDIHEARVCAVRILVDQYQRGDNQTKKSIYDFYLDHLAAINNWDLVDISAPNIVGNYLLDRPRKILYRLVRSTDLWPRRIAVVATYEFIRHDQFDDTLAIAKLLIVDKHDLIHKAVGWMLREVGKRSRQALVGFLRENYQQMPRTMLRYSIEHFDKAARDRYLKGSIN